jgi:methylated-DNA-[protein]-cysteine S-methyltransferase
VVLRHSVLLTLAGPLLAVSGPTGLRHLQLLPEADAWRLVLARLTAPRTAAAASDDRPAAPEDRHHGTAPILTEDPAAFKPLAVQLGEFFAGLRRSFDLPLDPQGTVFQRQVWQALLQIPYGQVRSYSRLAAGLGTPKAARAVGQAAAQNPLLILVPCHRVLGNDGRLVGFSAGTELKARLLRLEGHSLAAGNRLRPPRLF